MTTPWEIRWFSRLFLASLMLSAVVTAATWKDLIAPVSMDLDSPIVTATVAGVIILSFAFSALLWWLIVWRRSVVAKWILTALTLLGVAALAVVVAEPFLVDGPVSDPDLRPLGWRIAEGVSVVTGLAANILLFRPDALRWFRDDRDVARVFS